MCCNQRPFEIPGILICPDCRPSEMSMYSRYTLELLLSEHTYPIKYYRPNSIQKNCGFRKTTTTEASKYGKLMVSFFPFVFPFCNNSFPGPGSAVCNKSNCSSRGPDFDPSTVPYFRVD